MIFPSSYIFSNYSYRLEKMKDCLDPLIELIGCFRSKELLYQKAFIKRCQNLQKAEAEVCSITSNFVHS